MPNFFSAFALLLLGQVPLVVKLWLDQKNTISGHRLELYKRQLAAAESLTPPLMRLQASCDIGLLLMRSDPADANSENRDLVTSGFSDEIHSFQEAWEKSDAVLPASLVLSIDKYYVNAIRIMLRARRISTVPAVDALTYEDIQTENQNQFNAIRNALRLILGTDPLSAAAIRQVHRSGADVQLLMRGERRLR